MSMIVGIDLGTSNSCVAVFREGEAEVLPNARGERLTPSCVAFDNERILTGEKALEFEDVSNKIHDFKRIIGLEYDRAKEVADYNEWSFILRNIVDTAQIQVKYEGMNQYFNAGEISAIVLDEPKTLVMKKLGCEEIIAVITVPTHFTPKRRAATLDAAKVAGIQVLRLINESTAAAIAVGVLGKRSRKRARRVLVFDLGGGTLDITIVEIKNRSFDVKGYAGDLALGGIDLTRNLAKEIIRAIKLENNLDELDENFRQEIINEAEKAKIRLSVDDVTRVNLEHGNYHYRANFTRTEMTELNKKLHDRVKDCVEKALKNGATDSDKIHDVVLVGGSVRIPYIRKMMKDRFGEPKIRFSELYCDELIAEGAALLASHLSGVRDTGIGRLHFNDITPLSLGTDVVEDGTSIIIPRNSKLPATFTRSYLPVNDATEISIKIYQGDNEASPENELIGYFDIPITRTQNVEVKIDVTFDLDCSNLLCATALQRGTGNTRDIQITVAENQNEATIQEQRDRLERIKRNEVALENAIGSMEKECDNLRKLTQFLQRKYKRPHVQDRCKQSLKWMSDNVKNVTENAVAEPKKITKKLREMIKELESLELKERQGEQNGRDNQELGTEPEVPEDDREALERAFCSA